MRIHDRTSRKDRRGNGIMKFIVCKNAEEIAARAAAMIAAEVKENPRAVLGLATGSTPEATYKCLIDLQKQEGFSLSGVTTFNLDEYYPIRDENPQSYHYYMNRRLFDHTDIPRAQIHLLDGTAEDADAACAAYESSIEKCGGIDLQLLGIGENGHIGFNEPGDFLHAETHKTALTDGTIAANARFFERNEDVPRHALTVGMSVILGAKRILLLAIGPKKRAAVTALRDGRITTAVPATMLKMHPHVTVICDEAAYGE